MRINQIIRIIPRALLACMLVLASWLATASAQQVPSESIYDPGKLAPQQSDLNVKAGEQAPDFELPAVEGGSVRLSSYRGRKIVVISFVPAAFTPVCSDQWPGYNLAREMIQDRGAVVIGITTDNIPALFAWTQTMGGVWFPVLSDFWPHGEVAREYGVLRESSGTTERALFIVDRAGVIRYIDVHDINDLPRLETLIRELDKLQEK